MKRLIGRCVALILASVLAVSQGVPAVGAASKLPFDDISNSYAKDAIMELYNRHIVSGTSKTSFSPAGTMTRAEFVTALDRLLGLEPVAGAVSPFRDMPREAWFYGWVQAAVHLGLVSGLSATAFAPSQPVTRQEAAVWIARAMKQMGQPTTAKPKTWFKDGGQVAEWASTAVSLVYERGLMKGDLAGYFHPAAPISRQETAVLLHHVLEQPDWAAALASDPEERITLGWKYGQTNEQYVQSVIESGVNTLSPRWYVVGKTGKASDATDVTLAAWAKSSGKRLWPMVTNGSDQEATHLMLSNATARNTAIVQLAALAGTYGLDGLNIDFENVAPADRTLLTTFISMLAAKLHAAGKTLSVDVSPDRGTDWTEAFDYEALGQHADYLVLMGYDEYYSGSPLAGPNASFPYVQAAVSKLLQSVKHDKMILALPFYNRDWMLKADGKAASAAYTTLNEQNEQIARYALKPVWNAALWQYEASYMKQTLRHRIWLEEGRSLTAKYRLIAKHDLAGAAYWYLGGESPDIWSSIRNAERYDHYAF